LVSRAKPNSGHHALAELETLLPCLELITQNVDGLHQKAGTKNIIEFHGNITRSKCLDRHTPIETAELGEDKPPKCPCCGGLIRPDVVWFGEALNQVNLNLGFELAQRCDVFLSIGTSSQVYPAAGLIELALEAEALTIEVNPNRTPVSGMVDFFLEGSAGDVLPALVAGIRG
ncbi:MAG: Sir2 family NAD-dependent protein deacetylase, partial [Pseudomonadota bacterium]